MKSQSVLIDLSSYDKVGYTISIENALSIANHELANVQETIDRVKSLQPKCDKLDYILSASVGALCGIIDIFLVGKPGESPIGNITEKWFENRTTDFAVLCGWNKKEKGNLSSAIRYLEQKFSVPYDQTHVGEAAKEVFNLSTFNHHFKSLGHNPTLLGLFFSLLDQFMNESHFVSGELYLSLEKADNGFELRGHTIPAKFLSGIVNWFGHIMSDISGSSGSSGRGMGIPSPIWAWINDIIVLTNKLHIPADVLNRSLNDLAVNIYQQGFDLRFQTAQLIPVFLTEFMVRFFYSIRRMYHYFSYTEKGNRNFNELWQKCEPFSNPTVKRMLTVAHGTYCLLDVGDAVIRSFIAGSGYFNVKEFFLRFNIVEFGRFTISLYGEGKRAVEISNAKCDAEFALKEKIIIDNYIAGLNELGRIYDDRELLTFVDAFKSSDVYQRAFQKSVDLAILRNVPKDQILTNKKAVDDYFLGGK